MSLEYLQKYVGVDIVKKFTPRSNVVYFIQLKISKIRVVGYTIYVDVLWWTIRQKHVDYATRTWTGHMFLWELLCVHYLSKNHRLCVTHNARTYVITQEDIMPLW
jgi:hypothetical protein